MIFPKEIKKYVEKISYIKDDIGCSGDEVYVFDNTYVLKISKDSKKLLREKQSVDWINNKIPGSKSIYFIEDNNMYYYLRSYIKGDSLISERFLENPLLMIETLVKVNKILRSLDLYECPFNSTDNIGSNFVHGDLCLPNIYVNKENEFVGFIDLDNCGLGDKWYDYSWLLWSIKFNLKTDKYNSLLLEKLNLKMEQSKFNLYIPEEYRKH